MRRRVESREGVVLEKLLLGQNYSKYILTAGHSERAFLTIKRIKFEIHWAGKSQGNSENVMNFK